MDQDVIAKNEVTVDVAVNEMEETESDEAYLLTNMKNEKGPCTITINWQFLVGIFSIAFSLGLMISQNAVGVPVFLIRYLFLAHGILLHNLPEQKCNVSVAVNGQQFNQVQLRKIALYCGNICAGVTGIILTVSINRGYYVGESFCYILGIILSIMIIITTVQAIFDIKYKTQTKMELENFSDLVENSIRASWKHCHGFIDAVGRLLPMVNDDSKQLSFSNKELHIICIAIGMLISTAMFSAQIWILDTNSNKDVENFFAKGFVNGLFGTFYRSDRVMVITISSVIAFLVSITMICLIARTTHTRLLFLSFLGLGIGTFFIIFSSYTVQYIILMGIGLPGYFEVKLVYLSIFICVPILGSLFLAISYSSITQIFGHQTYVKSSSPKTWLTYTVTLLAILLIFLSAATMFSTNWTTMMVVQEKWNSTDLQRMSRDCVDEQSNYYGYRNSDGYKNNQRMADEYNYDYELPTTTTTTSTTTSTTQRILPEKCFGKELAFQVQYWASLFSISHLSHIESLLFFSFFILLTGKKVIRGSLFLPGLLLFGTSILTVTFGIFTATFGRNEISSTTPTIIDIQNKVFILNCISIGTAFITGVVCLFVGNEFLINLLSFVYKFILILIVLLINILYTLYGCVIKAAGNVNHMAMKKKQEPKIGTEQEPI